MVSASYIHVQTRDDWSAKISALYYSVMGRVGQLAAAYTALLLIRIVQRIIIRQLTRELSVQISFSTENYASLRVTYEDTGRILGMMEEIKSRRLINKISSDNTFDRNFEQIISLLTKRRSALADAFEKIENRKMGRSSVFSKVSQQELWQNRNKAYSYRV